MNGDCSALPPPYRAFGPVEQERTEVEYKPVPSTSAILHERGGPIRRSSFMLRTVPCCVLSRTTGPARRISSDYCRLSQRRPLCVPVEVPLALEVVPPPGSRAVRRLHAHFGALIGHGSTHLTIAPCALLFVQKGSGSRTPLPVVFIYSIANLSHYNSRWFENILVGAHVQPLTCSPQS